MPQKDIPLRHVIYNYVLSYWRPEVATSRLIFLTKP